MLSLRKCIAALMVALTMVSGACAEPQKGPEQAGASMGKRDAVADNETFNTSRVELRLAATMEMLRGLTSKNLDLFIQWSNAGLIQNYMPYLIKPLLLTYFKFEDSENGMLAKRIALTYFTYHGGTDPNGLYMQMNDIFRFFATKEFQHDYGQIEVLKDSFVLLGPRWMSILEEVDSAVDRFRQVVHAIAVYGPQGKNPPLPQLKSMSKRFPCNFNLISVAKVTGLDEVTRFQTGNLVENALYSNILKTLDDRVTLWEKNKQRWKERYTEMNKMLERIEANHQSSVATVSKMAEFSYIQDIIAQDALLIQYMREALNRLLDNLEYLNHPSEPAFHLLNIDTGGRPKLWNTTAIFQKKLRYVIREDIPAIWNKMARAHDEQMENYVLPHKHPDSWFKMEW